MAKRRPKKLDPKVDAGERLRSVLAKRPKAS